MQNKSSHFNIYIPVIFLFLLLSSTIFSQTPKGLIVSESSGQNNGITRAIIIGISKYQFIDSLQYADRDAEVFASYLRNNSFWNIKSDDIILLTNDKARYGDLTVQLQKIALISKPGDNLLFYFSGHGDVETKTIFNRGFLLAYDTYSSNYMNNGLRVDDLKDIFITLQSNNVKVIVVTDACRSGNLAGGMKGAEFTATALSAMWKNEIKILSSQPGQLSYEDKKWGNGRGVFSYYLINGLNGEADANKDSSVTLAELEMYVGSNVAKETGNKQQPLFEGPNKFSTIIARINPGNVNSVKSKSGNTIALFSKKINIPFDSCNFYYRQMNNAILSKQFSTKDSNSASSLYTKFKSCSKDSGLIIQANAELMSALMNECQEIVINSFIGKNLVPYESFKDGIELIDQILKFNDLKLIDGKHWNNLRRYLYVQGNAMWYEDIQNKIPADLLDKIIDSAITEETDAAYLIMAKAVVEMRKENWLISIKLLNLALTKSPTWLMPKYYLGICYSNTNSYSKALEYYDEILKKDTSYKTFECTKCILGKMAEWAWEIKKYKKGIDYYLLSIDHFPDYWPPYDALYDYSIEKKDTITAEKLITRLKKYDDTASMRLQRIRFEYDFYKYPLSVSLPPVKSLLKNNIDSADYYFTLAIIFKEELKNEDSAAFYYRKAVDLDPTDIFYLKNLTEFLIKIGYDGEAQQAMIEKMEGFEGEEKISLKFLLANSYIETENFLEAFTLLKEIKEAGFYTCADLRSMKKVFSKLSEYQEYIKICSDK